MEIDLIDDIWSHIFNYFGVDRARLAVVCKRWSKVILHPLSWRTFEADFYWGRKVPLDRATIPSLQRFIAKYCTHLIDCHITTKYVSNEEACSLLNTLLQIKTLRRLALRIESGVFGKSQETKAHSFDFQVPQCKDLVLLNLQTFVVGPEKLQELLVDLPNIEELYLKYESLTDASVYAPLTKLKKLAFDGDVMANSDQVLSLTEMLPTLQCILYQSKRAFGDPNFAGKITKMGNTTLIPISVWRSRDVSTLKELGKFASPAHQPLLLLYALHFKYDLDVIHHLITEQKFDVNFVNENKFHYVEWDPTIVQDAKYPLQAAVLQRKSVFGGTAANLPTAYIDVVEELLKLGANPNSPLMDESPLVHCTNATTFLLLLKYGANPNKLVRGYPALWSIFKDHFVDAEAVVREIVTTCDLNAKYGEKTMLETVVTCENTSASLVSLLIEAGAQWTPEALNAVAEKFSLLPIFEDVVQNRKADLSMLKTSVVFGSLERGMLPAFQDHLKTLGADKEEPHLSPMHYAALLNTEGLTPVHNMLHTHKKSEQSFNDRRWANEESTSSFGFASKGEKKAPRIHRLIRPAPETNKTGTFGNRSGTNPASYPTGTTAAPGGGFGQPSSSTTTGFGQPTSSPASGFGQPTSSTPAMFGQPGSSATSVFGQPASSKTSLFGQPSSSTTASFGQMPAISSFGAKGAKTLANSISGSKLQSINVVITLLNCSINEKNSTGATPLLLLCKSAKHSSEEKVKNATSLLKHGANVNMADNQGWTPLHAALYTGDWDLAALLLQHGANINAQDVKGITPLMASIYGFRHIEQLPFDDFEVEWAKLLTSNNVDVALVDHSFSRSLVHLMAAVGSPAMFECAEEQFLKPELVNAKDIEGFTPLHYAIMFDNIDTVKYLLSHGADANAQTTALKLTAAMLLANLPGQANINKHLQTYNTLLLGRFVWSKKLVEPPWLFTKEGDNPEREGLSNFGAMLEALLMHSNLALIDSDGNTALHHLVSMLGSNQKSMVEKAIGVIKGTKSFKSYWSTNNFENRTPANMLFKLLGSFGFHFPHEDIVPLIKAQEIDLNHEGAQALAHLLRSSLPNKLKVELMSLIDHSHTKYVPHSYGPARAGNPLADVLVNTSSYDAPLIKAVLQAYPNSINELVDNGATPLILYVLGTLQKGSYIVNLREAMTVIDVLLAAPGIELNAQDDVGNTALHYACKYFHTGFIDALDANLITVEQGTAALNCLFAFKLVEAGARMDLKNKHGQTPLDFVPLLMTHYEKVYPIVVATLAVRAVAKKSTFLWGET